MLRVAIRQIKDYKLLGEIHCTTFVYGKLVANLMKPKLDSKKLFVDVEYIYPKKVA